MNDIVKQTASSVLESVIAEGDLSKLSPEDRVRYYNQVCESLGLNPLTKPFEYMRLQGKLTLYARKDCTEQLRKLHNISITISSRELVDDCYIVSAKASDGHGRSDESIGAVSVAGLKGEAKANAMMKAETKAKRRVTLSIAGLGMLDEHEVETIPGVQKGEPKQIMSPQTRQDLQSCIAVHGISKETVERWIHKAEVPSLDCLPEESAQKILEYYRKIEAQYMAQEQTQWDNVDAA